MAFTTRPELVGTFGMATSTHWIASAVGMKILEAGGTAFDAAVAMGFTLNVVEPHLNGPLGDMPALIRPAGEDVPTVICGQGVAPARATIEHYRDQGLDLVPGSGLLAAVVPGAFDAWMLMLRDHGHLRLREVLEPAIHYAEAGHPILPAVCTMIDGLSEFFPQEWPTSAAVWMPGGSVPKPGSLFRNPDLAAFWRRLLAEAETVHGREAQIEAARAVFYNGFVAEAIGGFVAKESIMDSSGERHKGVLSAEDMASWRASYEQPISVDYHHWTVWKAGPWTQGPVLLQALRILEHDDISGLDPYGADFVHLVTETLKLAFADREAYYGDPDHSDIPMDVLLSAEFAAKRRAEIGPVSSTAQRPGQIPGFEHQARSFVERASRSAPDATGVGAGEPTMAHLTERKGDTVHLDVIDRWGNMVSATPSGGWLQSSPVIPGLGVPLNNRGQMFWLEDGLPTSLAPGRRPRTTLTPSMAEHSDGRAVAFGTPGGDQQEQWQLIFLLRLIHHGMNLQEAIDGPLFHTAHLQSSFYPRATRPGHLMIEPQFEQFVQDQLRSAGHDLELSEPWAIGRLTAAMRDPDGVLKAAATPRLMQAYAIGR